jgi:hypothetical protein
MTWLLAAQAAASVGMCGIAWFVQVVHYPLFGRVGADAHAAYHAEHMRRTTRVVFPPMLVELVCAAVLVAWRPDAVPAWAAWLGAVLVAVLWASTGLLQIPLHGRLACGPDASALRRLVATSWLRTAGWSARAALALWMLAVAG